MRQLESGTTAAVWEQQLSSALIVIICDIMGTETAFLQTAAELFQILAKNDVSLNSKEDPTTP